GILRSGADVLLEHDVSVVLVDDGVRDVTALAADAGGAPAGEPYGDVALARRAAFRHLHLGCGRPGDFRLGSGIAHASHRNARSGHGKGRSGGRLAGRRCHELSHRSREVDDVELAPLVLAERRDVRGFEDLLGLAGGVGGDGPDPSRTEVAIHVPTLERRDVVAAIHVSAGDGDAHVVAVLDHRIGVWTRTARGVVAVEVFLRVPAV